MTGRSQSRGQCVFCGRAMTRSGLSKHLSSCSQREEAIRAAESKMPATKTGRLYQLQVRDAYSSDFWLLLEINGDASLKDLDYYLRGIWLECCGHLSRFSVGGWRGEEIPMSRKIERVFRPGLELTHIYDFGSSSETLVKAIDAREGSPLTKRPIFLMARNNMPQTTCTECEEPAGWLCVQCLIEEAEWTVLCEKHAAEHPHDDYGEPVELVNSPRLGVCGYEGPAEPPY